MAEQEKRLRVQREKEQENRDRKFDTAKSRFERKPYYMAYGKGRRANEATKGFLMDIDEQPTICDANAAAEEEWEKEIKKRYPLTCPFCQKEIYATKSLGHMTGMYECGAGKCVKCGRHMHLTYIPETDSMAAETWDDYINKQQGGDQQYDGRTE
jgi:hypothetical protein